MRILFLDLDTLRPDHLGCYGYHRNTSPNIDRMANEGVRFTNYFCSDAPCLPSRAALMSGRFGIHTGVVGQGGSGAEMRLEGEQRHFRDTMAANSLPATMRWAGLKTALVSPFGERHAAWWFYAGFNEVYNTGKGGMESAEDITPTALDWIERNAAQDNWYLHINYWDAHTPYRAPAEFGNPFKDDPLPDWLTAEVLEEHRKIVGPHNAREISMYSNFEDPNFPRHPGELKDMNDLRRMIDGYDCGIRYLDSHIGQIFDALEKQGVMDNLVVIISADHGENMGELGIWGEHATADAITPHIPMIIRWPGKQTGHIDDGFHYNLDLIPTLADLLNQKHKLSWDGQSYASAITEGEDCGRDYLVLGQLSHTCQRSVRFDDWIYVRTYHDGFHLFPKEMLFNVKNDPHETCDLAEKYRDICKEAVYKMQEWHDEMMLKNPSQIDPLWTVMHEGGPHHCKKQLAKYCQHLENTDRGWAIEELKRRHPGEFED